MENPWTSVCWTRLEIPAPLPSCRRMLGELFNLFVPQALSSAKWVQRGGATTSEVLLELGKTIHAKHLRGPGHVIRTQQASGPYPLNPRCASALRAAEGQARPNSALCSPEGVQRSDATCSLA